MSAYQSPPRRDPFVGTSPKDPALRKLRAGWKMILEIDARFGAGEGIEHRASTLENLEDVVAQLDAGLREPRSPGWRRVATRVREFTQAVVDAVKVANRVEG